MCSLHISLLTLKLDGRIVHSYGRLIPHEFPITNLQQISGPDGIGRITCTGSSGAAKFHPNSGQVVGEGVTKKEIGSLEVNPSDADSFQNRALYCTDANTNFFYLFISSASKYTQIIIRIYLLKVGWDGIYNVWKNCMVLYATWYIYAWYV